MRRPDRTRWLMAAGLALSLLLSRTSASGQVSERQPGEAEIAPRTTVIPPDQVVNAVAAARQAIHEHRDSADAYLQLGVALRSGGDLQGALDAINLALSLNPALAAAWLQKGLIATENATLKAATEDFRRAVDADPQSVPARLEFASMLFRNGDFAGAGQQIEATLGLDPKNPNALDGLGFVQMQRGDLSAAAENFRRAIAERPRYPEAQENLGDALLRMGDWAGARRAFEQALLDKPEEAMAVYGLATALRHLGDTAQADAKFAKARSLMRMNIAMGRARGENNRGLGLWYANDLTGAAAAFRSALAQDPTYAEAHNNLGGVLWQQNDFKEATREFAAAVRDKPDFAKARNNLGNALMSAGDSRGAIEQFTAALSSEPGFAAAHVGLGTALVKEGQKEQAEMEFRRALTLDPALATAHFELGLLLASGAPSLSSAARTEIEAGIRLDPRLRAALPPAISSALAADAQNRLQAAAAAEQAGRYEDAADLYQRFLAGTDSSKISSATRVHATTRLATAYFLLHRYRESLEAIAPLTSKNSGYAQLPAQAWLVDGLDRLEAGQVPEAIVSLRRTLDLNPDSGTARLALADAFERSGRLEEATGEYEEQTQRTPAEPDAWYKLGLAYARLATTVSHDFSQKFPDSVVGQQLAAEDLLSKGDDLSAAGILLRLVRRASSQPGIHAALGSALLNQEFPKSAEDQFRQELSQDPDCPLARLGLAETAFLRGDWREAISDLGRLARFEPRELARLLEFRPPPLVREVWEEGKIRLPEHLGGSPEVRLWEAWLRNSASLPVPAAPDAGQPCPNPSSNAMTTPGLWLSEPCYRRLRDRLKTKQAKTTVERLKLAEAEFRLGNYQAARSEAQRVLASNPRSEWGVYWLSHSDGELAEDCLSKAACLSPDSARVHQMLGEYFVERHNLPRARTEYEAAIRLAPDLAELHLGLGTVHWLQRAWPEAETELERTLVLAPGSTVAQYELGDTYVQQRRWPLAIDRLRRAVDDPALSIKARLDLSKAEAETGQINQAIEELLPIVKEDQDGEVYYRLAGFYRKLGDKTRMEEALSAFERLRNDSAKPHRGELEAMEKQREGVEHQSSAKPTD